MHAVLTFFFYLKEILLDLYKISIQSFQTYRYFFHNFNLQALVFTLKI